MPDTKVHDSMLAPPGPGAEVDRDQFPLPAGEKYTRGAAGHEDLPRATVRTAEEESINFNSILKGTAANRMNLFEKKAALINA